MKKSLFLPVLLTLLFGVGVSTGVPAQEPPRITIAVNRPGARISPEMWGIFFEDINFGADGGLNSELVKNGAFEFPDGMMGWKPVASKAGSGEAQITQEQSPYANSPHTLRIRSGDEGAYGVENSGFRGIGLKAGDGYRFQAEVRCVQGTPRSLRVDLVGADGRSLATTRFHPKGNWSTWKAELRPSATEARASLSVVVEGAGTVDLDSMSLTPVKTWKGRPRGLRADLVQHLADLHPGFLRFPGGCIVEGRTLDVRYQWKETLGPRDERKLLINRWNNEFRHRSTPDYFQSFGVGFYEYLQLCEDIGASPLPILNCGMACQFNSAELAPLSRLDPYIQDALDLIEFANGPVTSTWGAKRAALGHPKPFGMNYLGIGNEQWGPQYLERYDRFTRALKERYPEIKLIAAAGPSPDDDRFRFAWSNLRERHADIIDEHCYAAPEWFLDNTRRYDNYDRHGPKVLMGEYAAQSEGIARPDNKNNWRCALAEAAYMTGLERNADVVVMQSYAPLFGHVDAWQWAPDLIWFDNLRSYATPNYYVQQLFSRNRGDRVLPTQLTGAPAAANGQPRLFATSTLDEKRHEVILKVVNATAQPQNVNLEVLGGRLEAVVHATTLSAGLDEVNSLDQPHRVSPKLMKLVQPVEGRWSPSFPANSVLVVRLRCSTATHAENPVRARDPNLVEALIDQLQSESGERVGVLTSASFSGFAAVEEEPEFRGGILGVHSPERSETMTRLVGLGLTALPALLEHLTDARPTKITVGNGFRGRQFRDEYAYRNEEPDLDSRRLNRAVYDAKRGAAQIRDFDTYTVKVGDFCFAAVGQIVNRNLQAVRYQPTGNIVVNSPVETPALAEATRNDWSGLTVNAHRRSLLRDAESESTSMHQDALPRLLYYYPETGKRHAERLLKRPLFDLYWCYRLLWDDVAPASRQEQGRLVAEFRRQHGAVGFAALGGALQQLATRGDDTSDPQTGPLAKRLLAEHFPGKRPDLSVFINAAGYQEQEEVVRRLQSFHSQRLDQAVAALFRRAVASRPRDDRDELRRGDLALACAERGLRKGDGSRYAAYFREQATALQAKVKQLKFQPADNGSKEDASEWELKWETDRYLEYVRRSEAQDHKGP